MTNTVLTVVWPFASAILVTIAELILSRTKKFGEPQVSKLKIPEFLRQISTKDKAGISALSFLVIWTAALLQFLFSMASIHLVQRMAFTLPGTEKEPVSHLFFAVGSMVSGICILYLLRSRKRKAAKAAVIIAVLSYVLIAAELFLFNFNSLKANAYSYTVKGKDLIPDFEYDVENDDGAVSFTGDSIRIKADCDLKIPDVPDGMYSVTVRFKGDLKEPGRRFRLRMGIEDENSRYTYRTADVKEVTGLRDTTLFMKPYGEVFSLMLSFDGIGQDVTVDSVTVSECNVYKAMFIRYLAVFFVAAAIVWIVCLKLYNVEYDPANKIHAILITLVFILSTGVSYLFYYRDDIKFEKYPFENTSEILDIYELAFDSSMKKIPYLDVPVEEGIEDLDNPYDASERDENSQQYRWDYAYKDGKYYCYFGMAPVYVLYYPIYLITHRVPNYTAASCITGTMAVVAVIIAFMAAVKMFVPKKNLLAYLLMIPTVAAASLIYVNMIHSEKYYIACGMALAGMGFSLALGIAAVSAKKNAERLIMFFLSGVSLAVCAGSRPSEAVCAAVMLPMFFAVLLDRKRKLRFRISEALAFLVPVLVGIALILMHNYARFGSFTDFGENYQLTVSDIHSLKVTPEMLPSAIFYYFLMPFNALDTFPFFEARGIIANTYEVYRNIEPSCGLLNLPFILLGAVFTPGGFMKAKGRITKSEAVNFNGFVSITLICALFLSWFNFSRAGVCIRYISDFAWLLSICFGVILLRRIMRKSGRKTVYGIICVTCIVTIGLVFFMIIANEGGNLPKMYPTLLERCEDFFIFWH